MTQVNRRYRLRVATAGATQVDGNEDFILDLGALQAPPVVHSPRVEPLKSTTESRPFTVRTIDEGGAVIANLTGSNRWRAIGRLADVQFSDDGGAWESYGTGRVTNAGEPGGPGSIAVEISDESARVRKGKIFTVSDTTQFWPSGRKAKWRGFDAAHVAEGSLNNTSGDLYQIQLVAGGAGKLRGRRTTAKMVSFAESDAKKDPVVAGATEGNFEHLRLSYDGDDYEVVTFGTIVSAADEDILFTLREPKIGGQNNELVNVFVWVHSATTPPSSGDAFLHTPTAEPSAELPLHLGIDDATHKWGSGGGWIHPATLYRLVWDELDVLYDDASVTALEGDSSFPLIAPRVNSIPKDPEKWLAEEVGQPAVIAALRDSEGRRKLVDMRLPQDLDVATVTTLDASNAKPGSWQLVGRDMANSITWEALDLKEPFGGHGPPPGDEFQAVETPADLDNLIAEAREFPPIEDDDLVADVGRHPLNVKFHGTLAPSFTGVLDMVKRASRGVLFRDAIEEASRELLDIYQDGPVRGKIEVGRSTAETLEEGDPVLLDCESLEIPNPETGARSGNRLVRILGMSGHPAHSEIEYLDLGPSAAPLATPSVVVSEPSAGTIEVTVSGVPSGATAILQVVFTDSSSTPDTWVIRRTDVGNETLSFDAPGEGWAHARARSVAPHRIRSPWASDSLDLSADPQVHGLELHVDENGLLTIFGQHNSETAGVRIRWGKFGPEDADSFEGSAQDEDATDLPDGIEITDSEVLSGPVTVEVEPWTGFGSGSVSGSAGGVVRVSGRVTDEGFITPIANIQNPIWTNFDSSTFESNLQLTLFVSRATESIQVIYRNGDGTVAERYDLNVTPDTSFLHTIQDVALDALDPSGSPKGILVPVGDPPTVEITPYSAADGSQGDGFAGPTVKMAVTEVQRVPGGTSAEDQSGTVIVSDRVRSKQGSVFDVQEDSDGVPVISLLGDAELYGDLSAAADTKTILEAARDDLVTRFGRGEIHLGPEVLNLSTFALQSRVTLVLHGTTLQQPANTHNDEDSGTADSATSTTLTDTSKAFTADEHILNSVHITGGTGEGQVREIIDNDSDTLHIRDDEPWDTTPDGTSTYEIVSPIPMFTADSDSEELFGIRVDGLAVLDGNKANQIAYNPCIEWLLTGGPFDQGLPAVFIEGNGRLIIKQPKGSGVHLTGSPGGCALANIRVQQSDRYSFDIAGTDQVLNNLISDNAGLSGFICASPGARYGNCKSFGSGKRAITGDNHGFLTTQPGQAFDAACHAQENDGWGWSVQDFGDRTIVLGRADLNQDGGVRFVGVTGCIHTGAHSSSPGFLYEQPHAVEFSGGASKNRAYIVTDGLTSDPVTGADIEDNYIEVDDESQGQHFNRWGAVGSAHDHFAFGKAGSPATDNGLYRWRTDAATPPRALFQHYDGTTTTTLLSFDANTSELQIPTLELQVLGQRVADFWGSSGSDHEHFTFGKEGAAASGNPAYSWKTGSDATPAALFEATDGTTLKRFLKMDYANDFLELGSGSVDVIFTGALIVDDDTQSTSPTTGSIQTDGGLGVVKDTFLGGLLDVAGNISAVDLTLSGVLQAPVTFQSAGGPRLNFEATDESIIDDQVISQFTFRANDDSLGIGALLVLRANGAWSGSTGSRPTDWEFWTNDGSSLANRVTIAASGAVTMQDDLTVSGAVTMNSGLTLTGGQVDVSSAGNPQFVGPDGSLSFTGVTWLRTDDGSGIDMRNSAGSAIIRFNETRHVGIGSTYRLYFDGVPANGNTYIYEQSPNDLWIVVGGTTLIRADNTVPMVSIAAALRPAGSQDVGTNGARWNKFFGVDLDLSGDATIGTDLTVNGVIQAPVTFQSAGGPRLNFAATDESIVDDQVLAQFNFRANDDSLGLGALLVLRADGAWTGSSDIRPTDWELWTNDGSSLGLRAVLESPGQLGLVASADPSTRTDFAHIYAKGATAEIWVQDEAGNATQISPHDPEGWWYHHSYSAHRDKWITIHVERLLRDLIDRSGLKVADYIEEKAA